MHHSSESRERVGDAAVMDEAVVDGDRPPASRAVEPESGVGHTVFAGHDVAPAPPSISPGLLHADHAQRLRGAHSLAPQRVDHDCAFQLELLCVGNVLQLTASAVRHVRARCRHAMGRGFDRGDGVRKPRLSLAVAQLRLDQLARNRTRHEDRAPVVQRSDAQPAVDHAIAAHCDPFTAAMRHPCVRCSSAAHLGSLQGRRRSRSSWFTSCGCALPAVAFITWPTRRPRAVSLPARKSSAAWGFSAITASTIAASAASSLTWPRPRSLTMRPGSPPGTYSSPSSSLAVGPLMVPASISPSSSRSPAIPSPLRCSGSLCSLASAATSPITQLAASLAGTPEATTASYESASSRDPVSTAASYAVTPS